MKGIQGICFSIAIILSLAGCDSTRTQKKGDDAKRTIQTVTWEEIQDAVKDSICVDPHMKNQANVWVGKREWCGGNEPETMTEQAVQKAFEDSISLITSLRLDEEVRPLLNDLPLEKANETARRHYLGNEEFLRILIPHVVSSLEAGSMKCVGCPVFTPRPVRLLRWGDFASYLGAHVWPDLVKEEVGEDGELHRVYRYHICLGSNGISEMKDPDPMLTRAGFALAFHNPALRNRVNELWKDILSHPEIERMETNEERTIYLREKVPTTVARDTEIRRIVCERIKRYSQDLRIEIEECSSFLPHL